MVCWGLPIAALLLREPRRAICDLIGGCLIALQRVWVAFCLDEADGIEGGYDALCEGLQLGEGCAVRCGAESFGDELSGFVAGHVGSRGIGVT